MHQVTVPSLPATTEDSKNITLDAPMNEVKTQSNDIDLSNQERHAISAPTIKHDSVTSPITSANPQRTSEMLATHVSSTVQPKDTDRKDTSDISNTKSVIQIKATEKQANRVSHTAAKIENVKVDRASSDQSSNPAVTDVAQPEVSKRENHSADKAEIASQVKSTVGAKRSATGEIASVTQARSNQLNATAEHKMGSLANTETKVSIYLFDQSPKATYTFPYMCLLHESLLFA